VRVVSEGWGEEGGGGGVREEEVDLLQYPLLSCPSILSSLEQGGCLLATP
jgi:hypothetical protein